MITPLGEFLCLDSDVGCQIQQVDGSDGALLGAFAAAGAFVGVDLGAEALDGHGAALAGLDALHAADAARRAFLAGDCALVVILQSTAALTESTGSISISPLGQVLTHLRQAWQAAGSM